jgi:nucleoside-diphosphate-sugar epimerase
LCNSKAKPIIKNENLTNDNYLLDISKAKKLIGFRPTIFLENGLKKEISNF